jgi:proline iminopeptidase
MACGRRPHARDGTYLYCPGGSHLAMYDDQVTYFDGIVDFIRNVERSAISSG